MKYNFTKILNMKCLFIFIILKIKKKRAGLNTIEVRF